MAALVKDLKQRGLLDDTLVVWGGEFGRTPMLQGTDADDNPAAKPGRDHHKDAFSIWLAGGGVKGGITVGQTDDLGYTIAEDPVHVNDFHATLLHLLGLDHERLTFKFQGRAIPADRRGGQGRDEAAGVMRFLLCGTNLRPGSLAPRIFSAGPRR